MLYLLDTDVVSNLEKRAPNPSLVEWLREVGDDEIAIPLSVVFEIQKGIERARPEHPERAAEKEAWLDGLLEARLYRVVPPDERVARLFARMVCTPPLKHFVTTPPDSKKIVTGEDLLIAATAIVHGAAMVTFNEAHFLQIHDHFALPGLFHPGRLEWLVEHEAAVRTPAGP